MSTALVVSLNQAAINGIRAAGAKQVINVEGNGKCYIVDMITHDIHCSHGVLRSSLMMLTKDCVLCASANVRQHGPVLGPGPRLRAPMARPMRKLGSSLAA